MYNVMISEQTCKTLLLPLCALKQRMGLPLVVYTRRFDPVGEMQSECVPNWLSNAEPLFGNNSLHSLLYSVIRINICQNISDDAQCDCVIKCNSAFCESFII